MQEPHFVIVTIFLALSFSGCTSTNSSSTKLKYYNWSGLDAQLPNGTNATPSHNLPRSEYPFNNKGKYISSWAAEGNKRFGTKTTNRASSRKRSSRKPSTSSSSKYHKIVSGDTLYGLALKYRTSVSAIKRANGMRSDVIIKGKTIKIP